MKKSIALIGALLLAGCSTTVRVEPALFDLGPPRAPQTSPALPALPPISIAQISTPPWLDGTLMFYRLSYANEQQPRPYAQTRWTMTPAQLLQQQLKARIVQAGGVALATADGAANTPTLRIEADDFTQYFDTPGHSSGQVSVRASVFRGHMLLAQRSFLAQAAAPTSDAAGGARALAGASETVIADMMKWLDAILK
jgi:cholesterol transport system auxiliary component